MRGALRFLRSAPGRASLVILPALGLGGNPGDVGRRNRVQDYEDDSFTDEGDEEDQDSSPRRQETDNFDNPDQKEAAHVDFAAVIKHIRAACRFPTPPPQVADRNVSLYEQRVRAPPESRPSFLLPWSDASNAKMRRINGALPTGSLEFSKGPTLLKPRSALKRHFYLPLDGTAQAALY